MEILNMCKDTRVAENVKWRNAFSVQRSAFGVPRSAFSVRRSAFGVRRSAGVPRSLKIHTFVFFVAFCSSFFAPFCFNRSRRGVRRLAFRQPINCYS
jgi:hypothetical protein